MAIKKNRWYDQYPQLSEFIEGLRSKPKVRMNKLLRGMKKIITDYDPNLINKTVLNYPLGLERRWYDKDPLSWMTINALKFADETLRNNVIAYLKSDGSGMRVKKFIFGNLRKNKAEVKNIAVDQIPVK